MTEAARLLAAVTLTRTVARATGQSSYFGASFAPLFDLDRNRVATLAARAESGCKQARAALRAESSEEAANAP